MENILVPNVIEGFWMIVFSVLVVAAIVAFVVWSVKKPRPRRQRANPDDRPLA